MKDFEVPQDVSSKKPDLVLSPLVVWSVHGKYQAEYLLFSDKIKEIPSFLGAQLKSWVACLGEKQGGKNTLSHVCWRIFYQFMG